MTQWMKRHKILTLLAVLLLLSSCGAVLGDDTDDGEAPGTKRPEVEAVEDEAVEDASSQSPSPTEEAAVPEPTQQQVWVANYGESRTSYAAAVAAALALRPRNVDAESGSLDACRLMNKQRSLDKRVAQVRKSFSVTSAPTYDQALAALDMTASTICPEFAAFHQAQTAERTKRLKVEERRRKERAAQAAKEQARQEAAEERAQQAAAEQQALQENVYYENCTAVEAAGAAPIYAGDPGYSSDLDRDGDGMACDQ